MPIENSSYEYARIVTKSKLRVGDQQYSSFIVDMENGNRINVAWLVQNDVIDPRPSVTVGRVYLVQLELTPDGYSVLDYRENEISKLLSFF